MTIKNTTQGSFAFGSIQFQLNFKDMNQESASIYSFINPINYLNYIKEIKTQLNKNFSIKAWANQIGFSSPTILYEILKNQRAISPSYIPLLVTNLKLTEKERNYFDYLVSLSRAKNESEHQYYFEKIKQLRALEQFESYEIDETTFFQTPLSMLILEIINQQNSFGGTIKELHKKIRLNCSEFEIETTIDKLIQAGLLEKNSDGLKKKHYFLTSKPDMPSFAVKRFHRAILDIAKKEILEQDINKREYGSHMININKKDLPKAKQLIRDFTKTFIKEMEYSSPTNTETYNLSLQLFSLTESQERHL